MATYFLFSGATGTATGADWTNAFTALTAAIAAATASGDVIKVHRTHIENLPGATTYTAAANIALICVDKDNADALAVMDGTTGYWGHNTTTVAITFAGAFKWYSRGCAFKLVSNNTLNLTVANTDGADQIFELCRFWLGTGTQALVLGAASAFNAAAKFVACEVQFGNANNKITLQSANSLFEGCTFTAVAVPTNLLSSNQAFGRLRFEACDMSALSGNLVLNANQTSVEVAFVNCKLHASATKFQSQSPANLGSATAWFINCASGDVHYTFEHYNAFGSTVVSTAVFANDNPTFDGTSRCSWVVASTAAAGYYSPYVSPWIDRYHAPPGALTPRLEVMRDGSATPYTNDQVWSEWSYQGTSGSPLALLANDRMLPLGTPANQAASAKTAADWTGESGTAWFGTLDSGAPITPVEIGHLRARVCIGAPSTTIYVDPQVRV